jgi:ribosomal protein S27AE
MSDVPSELIPDEQKIIHNFPVCPGCGHELTVSELQHYPAKDDDSAWHRECLLQSQDSKSQVDSKRECPRCYAWSDWVRDDRIDATERVCVECGLIFDHGRIPSKSVDSDDRSDRE